MISVFVDAKRSGLFRRGVGEQELKVIQREAWGELLLAQHIVRQGRLAPLKRSNLLFDAKKVLIAAASGIGFIGKYESSKKSTLDFSFWTLDQSTLESAPDFDLKLACQTLSHVRGSLVRVSGPVSLG